MTTRTAAGAKNPLRRLLEAGQSPWIDNITRGMLRTGALQALVDRGVVGLTSNPSIFEKAIGGGVEVACRPPDALVNSPPRKPTRPGTLLLRRAKARTREALLEAVARGLGAVTPQDARGWFRHCGYHPQAHSA